MYYTNGNFTLYYEKHGFGKKNIIILPGWGFTRPTFNVMINYLSKKYTIYILDYPGFGKSSINETDLTIYDYASGIRELLQELNIENPIIIAHSFGGRIATLLSGYYNDKIEKQILIDIAGIRPRKSIRSIIRKYSYKLKKKFIKSFYKKTKKEKLEKLLKKYSSSDYYDLPDTMKKTFQNIVNEDLSKYLRNINTETVILWGEKDDATPLKDAYKIKKRVKNSELIVLKGASHYSYIDYSYLTLNIIEAFLNENDV